MRLIDADALVEDIKSEIDDDKETHPYDKTSVIFRAGMKTVIRIVKHQDTIEPVKHGRWILIYELPSGNYFKCSECNHDVFLKSGRKVSDDYRYCSGCGAKMDGNQNGN